MRFYLTVTLVVILMSGCARMNNKSCGACEHCNPHKTADDARTSMVGEPIENDVIYY